MRHLRPTGILPALFLTGLLACDRIQDDVAPDPNSPSVTSTARTVYTQPGGDVPIALATSANGATVYRIATGPRYGKLSFIANGYLLYRPDSTVQEAEDQFTLNRITDDKPKPDTIRVVIKPKPEALPCNAGAQPDGARTTLNTPVTIVVIANDRFCSGEPDFTTLKVAVAPKNGETKVEGKAIVYKPNVGFQGGDSFVYSYQLKGSTVVLSAIVKVEVGQPAGGCKVILTPDVAVVREGTPEINLAVLKNDRLCENEVKVSLKTQPRVGTVSVNSANEVIYKPAAGFSGTVDFTYQVCFANGKECPSAVVKISVEALNPACKSTAIGEEVRVKFAGDRVEIPVLANDKLCSPAQSLAISTKPLLGTVEVKELKVFYTPPTTGTGRQDKFIYQITTVKGEKVQGIVAIKLVN